MRKDVVETWRRCRALWTAARVRLGLDDELAALYAALPDVRFTGCRISVAPDETVPRWCPLVEVDWLPATRVMPPSTLAAPQVRRAAQHRLATVQIRPGGSAPC